MTLFTDMALDDRLQRALAAAGFVTPTPIQAAALPVAIEGRDLVGTAQTGTGKTAAFVVPLLQRLLTVPRETRRTRAVILAPTRELVEQILAVVRTLAVHTTLRAVAVYGGVAMHQQTHALRAGVEIVVACPGRLLDHCKRRNADLRELECVVLDEADRMLDMGFLPDIQEILGRMPAARQTMLFSATFANTLNAFVDETLVRPARVEVATAVPAHTVRHTLYQVKAAMKPTALTALLRLLQQESAAVLIFTRTRVTANLVVDHLRESGFPADVLHADKSQAARQETLEQFRTGVFPYLVATEIAARGIDVSSISHVINYDMPDNAESYLHRIGRTGRMERTGRAISLMTRGNVRVVREIETMLGAKIEVGQLEEILDEQRRTARAAARTSQADAGALSRKERRLKQFGPSTGRPASPERKERRHRDGDTASPSKARGRAADGGSRPEGPGGKPFAGKAFVHRKKASGKRQPGEVPSTPRPQGRAEHARRTGVSPGSSAKRSGGRKR
jgi:ATP-dependent RNA helicase RhlE